MSQHTKPPRPEGDFWTGLWVIPAMIVAALIILAVINSWVPDF